MHKRKLLALLVFNVAVSQHSNALLPEEYYHSQEYGVNIVWNDSDFVKVTDVASVLDGVVPTDTTQKPRSYAIPLKNTASLCPLTFHIEDECLGKNFTFNYSAYLMKNEKEGSYPSVIRVIQNFDSHSELVFNAIDDQTGDTLIHETSDANAINFKIDNEHNGKLIRLDFQYITSVPESLNGLASFLVKPMFEQFELDFYKLLFEIPGGNNTPKVPEKLIEHYKNSDIVFDSKAIYTETVCDYLGGLTPSDEKHYVKENCYGVYNGTGAISPYQAKINTKNANVARIRDLFYITKISDDCESPDTKITMRTSSGSTDMFIAIYDDTTGDTLLFASGENNIDLKLDQIAPKGRLLKCELTTNITIGESNGLNYLTIEPILEQLGTCYRVAFDLMPAFNTNFVYFSKDKYCPGDNAEISASGSDYNYIWEVKVGNEWEQLDISNKPYNYRIYIPVTEEVITYRVFADNSVEEPIVFVLGGPCTSSDAILTNEDTCGVVNVYDIMGRVIRTNVNSQSSLDGLRNGIYVVNGKKIIVNNR